MDALRRDYLKALTMLGLRQSVAEPEQVQHETLEEIFHGRRDRKAATKRTMLEGPTGRNYAL